MALLINLRHLEDTSLELDGTLAVEELDLANGDDVIALSGPLEYELEVQLMEGALLAQGRLELPLNCTCVRCLKPFNQVLVVDPWVGHFLLEGEEKVLVVNDCVDLTPHLREDIFLAFPQHPLCDVNCRGLPTPPKNTKSGLETGTDGGTNGSDAGTGEGSPWSALDKLKL